MPNWRSIFAAYAIKYCTAQFFLCLEKSLVFFLLLFVGPASSSYLLLHLPRHDSNCHVASSIFSVAPRGSLSAKVRSASDAHVDPSLFAGFSSSASSATEVCPHRRRTFFPLGCAAINSTSVRFPPVVTSYIYKRAQFLSSASLLLPFLPFPLLFFFSPSSSSLFRRSSFFSFSLSLSLFFLSPFFAPTINRKLASQRSFELQTQEHRVTSRNTRVEKESLV